MEASYNGETCVAQTLSQVRRVLDTAATALVSSPARFPR